MLQVVIDRNLSAVKSKQDYPVSNMITIKISESCENTEKPN